MTTLLHVVRRTAVNCVAELRGAYTLKTWVFGWLVRMLAQVTFFALVGRLVGTPDAVRYLAVGNAVVLACLESTIVVLSVNDERAQGTLPLLAASPVGHTPVFLARGLQWAATGMVSSTVALLAVPAVLGVQYPVDRLLAALPVVWLVGLASYGYGCALAGLVLRFGRIDWLVLNVGYLLVMTLAGVNVPVAFWPGWLSWVAEILPVTHGLAAVRAVLDGTPGVLGGVVLEAAVGLAWLVVAYAGHRRFIAAGRRRGTIEFG
ncbi:ABC transporter permease [Kutzneria kofuensis]|uniref:ABC-2 type transport system permease protein n=1 Tax=Kutzneria kofuensis TaxID=103725 RepID=A0A7W9KSW7_9PSEU|nr:ABC transporter permease [Kutzneria kofuensis]MBB5898139.1 ABC-2 type transport system permease protein [Kutzneria kofuensis]